MFIEPSHLPSISECLKPCAAGVVLTSALYFKAVTSVTVSTVLHVPMRMILSICMHCRAATRLTGGERVQEWG